MLSVGRRKRLRSSKDSNDDEFEDRKVKRKIFSEEEEIQTNEEKNEENEDIKVGKKLKEEKMGKYNKKLNHSSEISKGNDNGFFFFFYFLFFSLFFFFLLMF